MSIKTRVELLIRRRTKIVATLGPASADAIMIGNLVKAGVNVFRLNMSHGDYEFHRTVFQHISAVRERHDEPIAVLADLCGPKIRTGEFKDGVALLETGKQVIVTTRNVAGNHALIPSQYQGLARDVLTGNRILLDDGNMELRVESVAGTEIHCTVVHGGKLKNHKGINLPGVNISAPSLTDKDKADAEFALALGVDFLALSFVRRADDIQELRDLITARNGKAAIVAKIEKPEALDQANQIMDAADAIMVARGDLGVELNPEEVPVAQAQLIELARRNFKPVIVATQMLESMINHARPTRAEVTDITHAVTQGADAVMLSAETASGSYPIEAVKIMDRIARQTEAILFRSGAYASGLSVLTRPPIPIWEAIAAAVNNMTHNLGARAVLVMSNSGMSASTVASTRPAAPVIAMTSDPDTYRRMTLLWSVIPILSDKVGLLNPNQLARQVAKQLGLADTGQYILLVRGFHSDKDFNTPTITALLV
jgi:pyruvate kinase